MEDIKLYFFSGMLINIGIAFGTASIIRVVLLNENPFYITGVFVGGLFIGLGLMIFKMREMGE